MESLLDVNVLIALHDANHLFHLRAKRWFEVNGQLGWASCPITENGALRVMSQPSYPNTQPLSILISLFTPSFSSKYHRFWADDLSILDAKAIEHLHLHGPRQITDTYLLALAVRREGRFVTFDQNIPLSCVKGAVQGQLLAI